MSKQYYVYMVTNKHNTKGFTEKYNANKLVYYESFDDSNAAIAREKQIKNWHRDWKDGLIH